MECAGRAKRRRRFGCREALAQLKASSPLRPAGAHQMVVLTRSAQGVIASTQPPLHWVLRYKPRKLSSLRANPIVSRPSSLQFLPSRCRAA
jgi:hypothetical protein